MAKICCSNAENRAEVLLFFHLISSKNLSTWPPISKPLNNRQTIVFVFGKLLKFDNWYSWADWVRGSLAGNGDDAAIFLHFWASCKVCLSEWIKTAAAAAAFIHHSRLFYFTIFCLCFEMKQNAKPLSVYLFGLTVGLTDIDITQTHIFSLSWCLYPSSLQLWCLTVLPAINRRKICCSLNRRDFFPKQMYECCHFCRRWFWPTCCAYASALVHFILLFCSFLICAFY